MEIEYGWIVAGTESTGKPPARKLGGDTHLSLIWFSGVCVRAEGFIKTSPDSGVQTSSCGRATWLLLSTSRWCWCCTMFWLLWPQIHCCCAEGFRLYLHQPTINIVYAPCGRWSVWRITQCLLRLQFLVYVRSPPKHKTALKSCLYSRTSSDRWPLRADGIKRNKMEI